MELELDLFSGRPNPTLKLGEDEVGPLIRRLEGLPRARPDRSSETPALGYRGVRVRGGVGLAGPEVEPAAPILVYGGTVRQGSLALADPGRELERWLLNILHQQLVADLRPIVEEILRAV